MYRFLRYLFIITLCCFHKSAQGAEIYVKSVELSNGYEMQYQEAGDKANPVLLVLRNHPAHMTKDNHVLINLILKKLGDDYYVIAPYWRKNYGTDRKVLQYSYSHDDLVDFLDALDVQKYSIFTDYFAVPVLRYFACTNSVYNTELVMSRNALDISYIPSIFAQKYNQSSVFGNNIKRKKEEDVIFLLNEEGKCSGAYSGAYYLQGFRNALISCREFDAKNINKIDCTKEYLKDLFEEIGVQDPFSYGKEPDDVADKLYYWEYSYRADENGNKKSEIEEEASQGKVNNGYDEAYDYIEFADKMKERLDIYYNKTDDTEQSSSEDD